MSDLGRGGVPPWSLISSPDPSCLHANIGISRLRSTQEQTCFKPVMSFRGSVKIRRETRPRF